MTGFLPHRTLTGDMIPNDMVTLSSKLPSKKASAIYQAARLTGLYCCTLTDSGRPRSRLHDRHIFWLMTTGEAIIRYRGETHIVRPGRVLLIEPGEVHRDLSKAAYHAEMVVLSAELVAMLRGSDQGRYLGPSVTDDPAVCRTLMELVTAVRAGSEKTAQERHAGQFFRSIASYWTTRSSRPDPALVARTRRLFLEEPHSVLTLKVLSARLRCCPTYLCRVFTEHVGLGPHAYQLQQRLLLARNYLEAGQTVANTAAKTGFTDESHLYRHFRRRFASSPGAYQRAFGSQESGEPK